LIFQLEAVGGPWARRLASRREIVLDTRWPDLAAEVDPSAHDHARAVWTQSAFSEYASAAAFASIASSLLAANAPIDLVAACGDFVADEMLHTELSARVATSLGGAVPLEVDYTRLVRPAVSSDPLLRAAELVVRTSCVGEALTVPVLKAARATASSAILESVLARIVRDEVAHAELGSWFLDWAEPHLDDDARARLAEVAAHAVKSIRAITQVRCEQSSTAGMLDCPTFDATLEKAIAERVVRPLGARGIDVGAALP
jgi:hypothetical protein